MAEIDQNHSDPAQDHQPEYQPENVPEYQPENEPEYQPENEPEYQPENEHEHENTNEVEPIQELVHVSEYEEDKHELEDGIPQNTNPEELGDANETVDGGAEKWPGWPGESVFRMLVPAQKVGSIIGRKGEYIKKTCEETKARIKILDGPPGTRERAVCSITFEVHEKGSLWMEFSK